MHLLCLIYAAPQPYISIKGLGHRDRSLPRWGRILSFYLASTTPRGVITLQRALPWTLCGCSMDQFRAPRNDGEECKLLFNSGLEGPLLDVLSVF
ncbi:hypothetical protein AVEN_158812-1 [Araneus ventricosus]|uniref:Uncharacterized protein n=1 Tax=Araneus ventricosus TaxID=182803 RepID=A0A4Y2HVC6_ARAVE|nr:hypothetical protein AVEN_158812-1 [Araneus ventricosus]